MPDREPPKLNKQGQEIWFKKADGENGVAPVHHKGWLTFALALAWISFSAVVGMGMILWWALGNLPMLVAVAAPFVIVAPGMFRVAAIVRRHL